MTKELHLVINIDKGINIDKELPLTLEKHMKEKEPRIEKKGTSVFFSNIIMLSLWKLWLKYPQLIILITKI